MGVLRDVEKATENLHAFLDLADKTLDRAYTGDAEKHVKALRAAFTGPAR